MTQQLLDDIESLLRDIRAAGEWNDDHADILARWRAARGDAAMDGWQWWWKLPEDDLYRTDEPTREDAIAAAVREEPGAKAIDLVEARTWSDDIDVDDECAFAEVRNHETVVLQANHA